MLKDTQMFRSKMGAFRGIHIHATCLGSCLNKVKVGLNVYCALIGYSHNRCDIIGCKIERAVIQSHPIFIGPEHDQPRATSWYLPRCSTKPIALLSIAVTEPMPEDLHRGLPGALLFADNGRYEKR